MAPGLDTREPPVHWAGIRYYAGLSLVARTWHTVGTQLTIAEQTQGKKLKLLSLHSPILQNGKNNPCFPVGKEGPHEKTDGKGGHTLGARTLGRDTARQGSWGQKDIVCKSDLSVHQWLLSSYLHTPRTREPSSWLFQIAGAWLCI